LFYLFGEIPYGKQKLLNPFREISKGNQLLLYPFGEYIIGIQTFLYPLAKFFERPQSLDKFLLLEIYPK
jgi:hypothetical protein